MEVVENPVPNLDIATSQAELVALPQASFREPASKSSNATNNALSQIWNRSARAPIRTSLGDSFSKSQKAVTRTPSYNLSQTSSSIDSADVATGSLDSKTVNDAKNLYGDSSHASGGVPFPTTQNYNGRKSNVEADSPSLGEVTGSMSREQASDTEIDRDSSSGSGLLLNYANAKKQEDTDDVMALYANSNWIPDAPKKSPSPVAREQGSMTKQAEHLNGPLEALDTDASTSLYTPLAHPMLTLRQLPEDYQRLQNRYFPRHPEAQAATSADETVICLVCRSIGHIGNDCPKLLCSGCGAYRQHFAPGCPDVVICARCRTKGHSEKICPSKLKFSKADGAFTCHHCSSPRHRETDCPSILHSYQIPSESALIKISAVPVSCYVCGASNHFGADCSMRPIGWTEPRSGRTFSLENMKTYVTQESPLQSLKPHARRGRLPAYRSSDDDDLQLHSSSKRASKQQKGNINPNIQLRSSGPHKGSQRSRGRGSRGNVSTLRDRSARGPSLGSYQVGSSSGAARGRGNGLKRSGTHSERVHPGHTAGQKAWKTFIK
ncbi:MAG: hypothetical protein M1814_002154 [Vezdaea aestivalis]|nr:MAG: hypothetical protein M1814_002154 [Vezdaea aestivalis]